jgi:Transposase domain (DUF772)
VHNAIAASEPLALAQEEPTEMTCFRPVSLHDQLSPPRGDDLCLALSHVSTRHTVSRADHYWGLAREFHHLMAALERSAAFDNTSGAIRKLGPKASIATEPAPQIPATDRQAADAVRSRIDWKCVLGSELTDSGFDHTVLSEFRTRLVQGKAERLLLGTLLEWLRERGLVKKRDDNARTPLGPALAVLPLRPFRERFRSMVLPGSSPPVSPFTPPACTPQTP